MPDFIEEPIRAKAPCPCGRPSEGWPGDRCQMCWEDFTASEWWKGVGQYGDIKTELRSRQHQILHDLAEKVVADFKEQYSLPYEPASASHLRDCIVSAVEELLSVLSDLKTAGGSTNAQLTPYQKICAERCEWCARIAQGEAGGGGGHQVECRYSGGFSDTCKAPSVDELLDEILESPRSSDSGLIDWYESQLPKGFSWHIQPTDSGTVVIQFIRSGYGFRKEFETFRAALAAARKGSLWQSEPVPVRKRKGRK